MSADKSSLNQTGRKDLLKQANLLAAQGRKEEAFSLFKACITTYLDDDQPMRALAAAKAARSALGVLPHLQALLIRLYTSAGLCGEADKEIQTCLSSLGFDKLSLFQRMRHETVLGLFEAMEVRSFAAMEPVYPPKGQSTDVFIIQAGGFELHRQGQRLRTLRPGQIFGAVDLFYPCPRSAEVRAVEPGSLIRVAAGFLHTLCERHPEIITALRDLYTNRLAQGPGEVFSLDTDHRSRSAEVHFPRNTTLTALDGIVIVKMADDLINVTEVTIPKGMAIPAFDGIMILKYGMVEVDYDQDSPKKHYIRPGNVLRFSGDYAMASTNVRLIRAEHK